MKIIKNYLYNTAYQLFAIIVPLITTPYITRTLGSTGVGVYAYTNSVIQYFVLFGSIGISMYGNRLIAFDRDNNEKLSEDFWSLVVIRTVTIVIAYVAFIVYLVFVGEYRNEYLYQSIQIVAVIFDISWLFMGLEDFKRTVLRSFIVKLFSTIAIFVFVRDPSSIGVYILILSVSTLLGNILLWSYIKSFVISPRGLTLTFNKHILGSLKLFVPQISMQVYLVLNKTMLGSIDGVKSAGLYENSDKIIKISLTVITAIVTVMMPRMANTFAKNKFDQLHNYLYQTLDFVSFASILLAAGLAAVAPTFSIWFMGESFSETGRLIPVLALIGPMIAWSTVLGSQFLVMTRREHQFTISVTVGAIINVLANILLIKNQGTMGAVIATVLAETCITLIDLFFVSKAIPNFSGLSGKWKYILAGAMTFGIIRCINYKLPGTFVSLLFQGVICVIVYFAICVATSSSFTNTIIRTIKQRKATN